MSTEPRNLLTPTPEPATPRTRRDRLGTVVVAELVDQIVGGRFGSGTALPTEAELGEQFGVSRTVIRESVKVLQDKGLVSIRQGVGTVVRDLQAWNMIDDIVLDALVRHDESLSILDELVAVRAALEQDMAAAAATAMGSSEQLAAIQAALRTMERNAEDTQQFADADVEFHAAVMDLSGNRLARAIVTSIHDKARTTGRYHGATSALSIELTLQEHRSIFAAIERHDPAAASTGMHLHIVGSWARRRPPSTQEASGD
jgi:GntR family galactonate operon transcriptional repressor